MFKGKWVFVDKGVNEVMGLRIDQLKKEPCKSFSKYKGIRAPFCGCEPCMRLYLSNKTFNEVNFDAVKK
jgi:hypothetical protein